MTVKTRPIIHIGIAGGGELCREVLKKTTFDYKLNQVHASIVAVADPDPDQAGMALAKKMGLMTFTEYDGLYLPETDVHLIITLTPDKDIFEDILRTKPENMRLLSYAAFELFWKAIGVEEQKLRDRSEEMETIINGIQDFILVITPDRVIIEANDAFLKQMNYSREEVIGRKCHEVFQHVNQPCDVGDNFCPLNKVIRDKRPSQQIRTRVDHNGRRRYMDVSIFPIWEKDGKVSRFIEVSRDITDRKREQEEITRRLEQMVEERTRQLRETHEKLLHQDKMASLGKLSASVVHEINNPIAGILNLILLIKRMMEEGALDRKDLDKFSRYLNLMETETRRISRIVSNLLAFSRQSKMEVGRVDLNRLIDKILMLNANLLKINRVTVEKRLGPDVPFFLGSEDQLQQVFMNLVSNAAEAIEANGGGKLIIETGHAQSENTITVSVADTGIGISRENLSRLFEPFYTTKKKGKGVGLGLSVAYGIIEEHGGVISVDSEEGKGTRFAVTLPIKPQGELIDPQGEDHV
ncbi:MAG: PAS domain-containing protein [Deltaproteobacteria bacterium]|nr:PAS domain-containing protein [Deltaproteobacteria bacterium]